MSRSFVPNASFFSSLPTFIVLCDITCILNYEMYAQYFSRNHGEIFEWGMRLYQFCIDSPVIFCQSHKDWSGDSLVIWFCLLFQRSIYCHFISLDQPFACMKFILSHMILICISLELFGLKSGIYPITSQGTSPSTCKWWWCQSYVNEVLGGSKRFRPAPGGLFLNFWW